MKRLASAAAALCVSASLSAQTLVVKPYVQPGHGSTLDGLDSKVVSWLTDQKPGAFTVEFGTARKFDRKAEPVRTSLDTATNQHFFRYIAPLADLPWDSDVQYRVKLGRRVVREAVFRTRSSPGNPVRFIVVGDTAAGTKEQRVLAYQMAQAKADSMLIVGDIVYSRGRVAEYLTNFWGAYNNTDKPDPKHGAPMMQSTVFHAVLGNHDVVTNLTRQPDAFAAFYFFNAPTNGPGAGPWSTPILGEPQQVAAFKQAAGPVWPALGFYSFDNGPVHFLALDANRYVSFTNAALLKWIENDLRSTKQPWKLVFFHHPGFHSSWAHYNEQKMRVLAPLFEACGVDIVFSGHVHNYQRSKPLKFAPSADKPDTRGRVNGAFSLDEKFDGAVHTRPDGVIYIVTGGGGARLYDPDYTDDPEAWSVKAPENWAPFTTRFIADRHSFSLVDVDRQKLLLRQVDDEGTEVDRIVVTKGP
jgi:predicted phosphodiesterase